MVQHHRLDPRLLGDPAQLGALEGPLRAAGLPRAHPGLPGHRGRGRGSQRRPDPIENLSVPAVINHLTDVIGALEQPPILIGHSAGGVFTSSCWIAATARAWRSIRLPPRGACRAAVAAQVDLPVLRTVGRKKAAGFTLEQWRYAFTNTFTEEESRALYERYHIPASVRVLWGDALATLEPGHQDTFVNYDNDDRAPLLFISGGEDHLMPPSVQRSTPSTTSPTL